MSLEERSDALDKKLEDNPIDDAIATLLKDAQKRRRQIIALAISLMLDLWLTIGLAFLSIQARNTAIAVQNSKDSIVASCEAANEFRLTEAALWNHILAIEPVVERELTPEEQARQDKTVADFRVFLETTFAPKDCSNVIKD